MHTIPGELQAHNSSAAATHRLSNHKHLSHWQRLALPDRFFRYEAEACGPEAVNATGGGLTFATYHADAGGDFLSQFKDFAAVLLELNVLEILAIEDLQKVIWL